MLYYIQREIDVVCNGKVDRWKEKEIYRLKRCVRKKGSIGDCVWKMNGWKDIFIQTIFPDRFDFMRTGIYNQSKGIALETYIAEQNGKKPPADWVEAFELLRNNLSGLYQREKRVVFFDEMPWDGYSKIWFSDGI